MMELPVQLRAGSKGTAVTALFSAVFAAGVLLACDAWAQTASDVTPDGFQPQLTRMQGALVTTGAVGLEAPAGAESLSIRIASVTIEGELPGMDAAGRALVARLTGGRVPVAEIFRAAQDLEAAYAAEGLVLARVVLPAQSLEDGGRLRLVVVDGFIEDVGLDTVPAPVRERVRALIEPLVDRRGVLLADIERPLLLAGETFGVALDSALATGSSPGGTVLIIDAQHRSVTGYVGIDTAVSAELGGFVLDGGLEMNGLLGRGEVIYLRGSGFPGGSDTVDGGGLFDDSPRLRTLAAGAVVPIGVNGLTLNLEATQSRTTPDTQALPTTSRFERLTLRVRYPWIRSRAFNLSSQLSVESQTETLDVLTATGRLPIYRDDLRIVRLSGNMDRSVGSAGGIELDAIASIGLDGFGARTAADATPERPLSRQGADADFTKLEIGASYFQPLGDLLAFTLRARGQTSLGQALVKSEQVGFATFREISAFDSGAVSGDSGWFVRGDVLAPLQYENPAFPAVITPYAFGGVGAVYLEEPTAFEQDSLNVSTVGLGVEINSSRDRFSTFSLRAEYGRGFRDDDRPDEDNFALVSSFRF
jgi:hemolysin activation/secretion protein